MVSSRFVFLLGLFLTFPNVLFGAGPSTHLKKPTEWFATEEAKTIATNILSQQSALGGWPKNKDSTKPFTGDRSKIKSTFDNGATTDELRFLAKMYVATKKDEYKSAFENGFDHILKAQYANGGWPQYSPPPTKSYHRHITFNDNTMVRLLEFLREVATHEMYTFVPAEKRNAGKLAFDRGLACILNCQIKVEGKLTAWCAQHDEIDFRPRIGRSYELATISGSESVGIARFLMQIEKPSPEVVQAIEASVAWFEKAKLTGIKLVNDPDPITKKKNRSIVADKDAPPLWARFYEIETSKPIFSDRDGVKKYSYAEIGAERRNGYSWYGSWPQSLLGVDYPAWKKRVMASR